MKFSVDSWDPTYGVANEVDPLEPSAAEVRLDVEMPPAEWRGLSPGPSAAALETVLFVDGVRRIEARVWLEDDAGAVHLGICASFAAGVVRCNARAVIDRVLVGRGLFSTFGAAAVIETRAGPFTPRVAVSGTPEGLALALQERMAEAELAAAQAACDEGGGDLVIVDGPLRGRQHLSRAVGYVKTHHVAYLPADLHGLVGRLAPGERSPIFALGTSWTRLSWYLRLPGGGSSPWSGVVRCESSTDLELADAVALADGISAVLPRFASEAHKDPRAPQNLYPIAGLERELRRRLGDGALLYRALRVAAAAA